MLAVPLSTEIELKLNALAKSRGLSDADLAREFIEASIDELDDIQMAASRIEARKTALSTDEAWKALGLDD